MNSAHRGEQGQTYDDVVRVGSVPDEPAAGFPGPCSCSQGSFCDACVGMNGHVDVLETADQLTGHGPWVGEVLIKDRRDLGPDLVTITWTAWLRTTAAAFLVGVRLAVTWQWDVGIQLMKPEGVLEQRGPGSGRLSPGHLGHRRTEDSILLIMSLSMPSRHSPQQGSLGILLHPNATIRRHRHRKLPLKDLDDLFVPDDDAVRVGEDGFEVGVRVGGVAPWRLNAPPASTSTSTTPNRSRWMTTSPSSSSRSHQPRVFPLESPGQQDLLSRLTPRNVADAIADISLFRPARSLVASPSSTSPPWIMG